MGSKIFKALIPGVGEKTALEYESSPVGTPACASKGCIAKLSFVSRHKRKLANGTTVVMPSYRLRSKEIHALSCKYNLKGQLVVIAGESESDVFSSVDENKYEFRLHVLLRAFKEVSALESANKDVVPRADTKNKIYQARGRLTSYIRKLRQILELRGLCEDNSELSSLIVIVNEDKKVPWSKFYFDHTNLDAFIALYGVGKTTPPLAIAGRVDKITPPTEKFKFHTVKLDAPYVEPNADNKVIKPIAQIILKVPSLVSSLKTGSEYIFFGRWKAKESDVGEFKEGGPHWIYHNIEMYIENDDHFIEC